MSSISVIYQHRDFYVINKPCGISVHSENEAGIIPLLELQLNESPLWLVHRLDKCTSGALIVARTKQAAAYFQCLFNEKKIDKYYVALSDKKPKKKMGYILGDMVKARNSQWKLTKDLANPAETFFQSMGTGTGKRLFLVKPITGKTHQIRVALKSLGSPILGDTLYGGPSSDRVYLHASIIQFSYHHQPIKLSCLPELGDAFSPIQQQLSDESSLLRKLAIPHKSITPPKGK